MNQREIKFRLRIDNGKEIITSFYTLDELINGNLSFMGLPNQTWKIVSRDEFTGLKDRRGKEIYEGDILKDDNDDLFEVKFGELPLDKSGDCVCTYLAFYAKGYGKLGSPPNYECNQIGNWMEVIGSIYENPELLK